MVRSEPEHFQLQSPIVQFVWVLWCSATGTVWVGRSGDGGSFPEERLRQVLQRPGTQQARPLHGRLRLVSPASAQHTLTLYLKNMPTVTLVRNQHSSFCSLSPLSARFCDKVTNSVNVRLETLPPSWDCFSRCVLCPIRSCIVGCYTTEDYFLAKEGVFLLLDLLVVSGWFQVRVPIGWQVLSIYTPNM